MEVLHAVPENFCITSHEILNFCFCCQEEGLFQTHPLNCVGRSLVNGVVLVIIIVVLMSPQQQGMVKSIIISYLKLPA